MKKIRELLCLLFMVFCAFACFAMLAMLSSSSRDSNISHSKLEKNKPNESPESIFELKNPVISEPEDVAEDPCPLTLEEVELIALVTMAEAEGEPEEGQRLVIDTILNRVDSPYFPDTVREVIYQKNQFESMWNGRVDRCYVREDLVELVYEELACRTNSEVVFFRTQRYSIYGVPMFQVGHHYFSSYE